MQKEQVKDQAAPSRRGFFMGAAAAGATVAAVTALSLIHISEPTRRS